MDKELAEAIKNLRYGGQQFVDLAEAYEKPEGESSAIANRDRIIKMAKDLTEAGRNFTSGT